MSTIAPAPPTTNTARGPRDGLRVTPNALWILHRDDRARREIAERLAIRGAQLADPRDAARESAAAPRAILLGVTGDFEAELELVFQLTQRDPALQWLVLAESEELSEARRLFDTFPGEVVDRGSDPALLRERVRGMLGRRKAPPLSERQRRKRLSDRFTRWLADLDHPPLFAATDPKRTRIPVLVTGESGTGRGLLARYLHQLATGVPAGPFVSVPCRGCPDAASLRALWSIESGRFPSGQLVTLCLEDVDALPSAAQQELARWIEYGAPGEFAAGTRVRWIATAKTGLEAKLRDALAGLEIALPALRDQPHRVATLANASAQAWCVEHELPERNFSDSAIQRLAAYPWPGNLRELDAVVARSLAQSTANPVPAEALVLEDAMGAEPEFAEPIVGEAEFASPVAGDAATAGRGVDDPEFAELPPDEAESRVYAEPESAAPEPLETATEAPAVGEPGAPAPEETSLLLRSELVDDRPAERPAEEVPAFADDAPEALLDVPEMEGAFESTPTSPRGLRRLAGALSHEIGNPLVGIRSFAQMLPRRFEDPEFRRVAADRVRADTARIERALDLLSRLAAPPTEPGEREAIDLSALSAGLLAERRAQIQERGLVVLEELDREHAWILADREPLRNALVALLDAVFALVPDRGDVYVATQGPSETDLGSGFVRALVRFSSGDHASAAGLAPAEQSLGIAAAELLIEEQGGHLVLDLSEAPTALLLFELPAAEGP